MNWLEQWETSNGYDRAEFLKDDPDPVTETGKHAQTPPKARPSGRRRKIAYRRRILKKMSLMGNGARRFNCHMTIKAEEEPTRARVTGAPRFFKSARFLKTRHNRRVRNARFVLPAKGNLYKKLDKTGFDRWFDY